MNDTTNKKECELRTPECDPNCEGGYCGEEIISESMDLEYIWKCMKKDKTK